MVPPEKKFRDRSKSNPEVHVILCCGVVLLVCDVLLYHGYCVIPPVV